MNGRAHAVVLRAVLTVLGTVVGFSVFHVRFQAFECRLANLCLDWLPGASHTRLSTEASIVVFPWNDSPFRAVVTPSCSSLSSVLAIGCLASIGMSQHRRRLFATACAIVVVVIGNVLRIAASTEAGVIAGRASLVLFHDWVGGLMTLVYTVGGYVLLLWLLLPRDVLGAAEAPVGHQWHPVRRWRARPAGAR